MKTIIPAALALFLALMVWNEFLHCSLLVQFDEPDQVKESPAETPLTLTAGKRNNE